MNNNQSQSAHNNPSSTDNSWPVQGVLVDLEYVMSNKDRENVILIDARPETEYLKGHIPGAICLGKGSKMAAMALKDYMLRVKTVSELAAIFGENGIQRDSEVIVYGEKSEYYAIYVNWVLELMGVDKISFYNDGIDGAKKANIELTREPTSLKPVTFEPRYRKNLITSTEQVIENLESKSALLMDIRPDAEVYGNDYRAIRGGKIPGAIHLNIENNWVDLETKDLKPVAELKKIYSSLDPRRDIILTCQIGIRTIYTYTILKALGFDRMSNHDESWLIWGNRLDLPAENKRWAQFGHILWGDLLRSILVVLKNIPRLIIPSAFKRGK